MRAFNVVSKIWLWTFGLMCVTIQDSQNTRYCDKEQYFCVECGCFKTGITEHTLSCGENEVIRMEFNNNPIKYKPFNNDSNTCKTNPVFCFNGLSNNNVKTTYKDRIEVYRNCTLQNTCTITVKPVEEGNIKLVRYPYVCESYIQNISEPFSSQLTDPVFYFKGIDYINKTIDCDYSVYKNSGNLKVEIFYLHGDNICNKFNILPNTPQIINCTVDNVQLYTAPEDIQSNFLKIEIRNMIVTGDEVMFFKVHGDDLDVNCTGCITRPVSTKSPNPTTTTTTVESTTETLRSENTSPASTSNPPTTIKDSTIKSLNSVHTSIAPTESTTTNIIYGQSDQNPNKADFISKAEHEEKLNETYAMFGGILAGMIIINIVIIGIYCFISKRNKAEAPSESEYANAEFRLPDETESPQYQVLNL